MLFAEPFAIPEAGVVTVQELQEYGSSPRLRPRSVSDENHRLFSYSGLVLGLVLVLARLGTRFFLFLLLR